MWGTDGFQISDTPTTRYLFDGRVLVGRRWDYCSQNLNFPDIRIIYSTGPYNLQPEQTATFTLAVTSIFGVSYEGNCPDTVAVYSAAEKIKAFYDNNCAAIVTASTEAPQFPAAIGLVTFPNPTSGTITFRLPEQRRIDRIEILDVTGRRQRTFQAASNIETIDLQLPIGTYLYRMTTAKGDVVVGKMVVME